MPYKCENINLGTYDRRRKLTDEQKERIKKEYATGLYGHRTLAKMYGVSRDLIRIIVDPERAERVKARVKEHWKEYSDREKLTESVRKTRHYKKELYDKGLIKEETDENKC